MNRKTLALAIAAAALVLALVATPRAGAANSGSERKINAQMVLDSRLTNWVCDNCGPNGTPLPLTSCDYEDFVQFPIVKGAVDYEIVLQDRDPRVNTTYHLKGPPFADDHDGYKAPAGTHRFGGFTGGSGPAPCPSDPYMNGRFVILKAVAIMGQKRIISGSVHARRAVPGRQQIMFLASPSGPRPRTQSSRTGEYEYELPSDYRAITRWRVVVLGQGNWCVVGVRHCAESARVTFPSKSSADEIRRHVSFESVARHADKYGSASVRHPDAVVDVDD